VTFSWFLPGNTLEWVLLATITLYTLGIIWFLSGMRQRLGTNTTLPLASVIVAARDEEENIEGCLLALLAQDYPDFEIVVVDDGSCDGTVAIIEKICAQHEHLHLLKREEGGSKKAALTLAIAKARGEILMMTDADCRVGPGWIRSMVSYFSADVGLVIGFSQIGSARQKLGWRGVYEAIDFLNLMACIWGSTGRGHAMAASGQNLAYRHEVYSEVGGFSRVMHRASGDDVLLMQMVRTETDWRIAFASDPHSFSKHPRAHSWGSLLQQRSRWASNVPMIAKMDPLFFSYMIISYTLSWYVLATPVLWQMAWIRPHWIGLVLALKWGGEALLFLRVLKLTNRIELWRFWPLWALFQPCHIALVGGVGPLGLFSWKGKKHRWGLVKNR
jgi:cellulose synthase/poly-beta-1,6-N-acetylglucosamine synthase-like glycosyltransferase